MRIEVYTDGSATTPDKPGGWGYVIVVNGVKNQEGSGYMENASNNDAELQAAIEGLGAVQEFLIHGVPSLTTYSVTLVSDSEIILRWANGTYAFRQESKVEKYNLLRYRMQCLRASTKWIEGHTGDERNERCDSLANAARKQINVDDVKKKTKKPAAGFSENFPIYMKENRKLYIEYNGTTKEIDLENNIITDYTNK